MISRSNTKQTGPIHERAERSANRLPVPSLGWRQLPEFRDAGHASGMKIERHQNHTSLAIWQHVVDQPDERRPSWPDRRRHLRRANGRALARISEFQGSSFPFASLMTAPPARRFPLRMDGRPSNTSPIDRATTNVARRSKRRSRRVSDGAPRPATMRVDAGVKRGGTLL